MLNPSKLWLHFNVSSCECPVFQKLEKNKIIVLLHKKKKRRRRKEKKKRRPIVSTLKETRFESSW